MRLNPKSTLAVALSIAVAWMIVEPSSIYAQKGGSKGRGASMSKSRGGSGGISRGGMSQSRGMSSSSMRGSSSFSRGMSSSGMSQSRGMSSSGMSQSRGMSSSGMSQSRGMSSGTTRGGTSLSRGMSGRSYGGSTPSYGGSKSSYGGSTPSYGGSKSFYGGSKSSYGGSKSSYGGRGTMYGSNNYSRGGNYDQGKHNRGGSYYGGKYDGRYSGYRPSYNQFYFGPNGLGYSYYGDGFGISIGLPLNRYYNNYGYYDYYNVAQPYYVESYPYVASYPYYGEYVLPSENVEFVDPGLAIPNAAPTETAISPSVIVAAGNAGEFQAQAEQAFREHRYEDAARLSNHAVIEDSENGKLHLFASQVLFALGDYRSSAAAIQRAATLLDRSEWGYVVENFKEFYRGKDYVTQMDELVQFTRNNPDLAYLHFLRGYHYKYLGYDDAARAPLTRAVELESRDRLAADILAMAGGQLPASATPTTPTTPNDPAPAESDGQLPADATPNDPAPAKETEIQGPEIQVPENQEVGTFFS